MSMFFVLILGKYKWVMIHSTLVLERPVDCSDKWFKLDCSDI